MWFISGGTGVAFAPPPLVNLQQDEVLAELKEYARSDPTVQDAQAVELYLEALNKRIILGKVRILMLMALFYKEWKRVLFKMREGKPG